MSQHLPATAGQAPLSTLLSASAQPAQTLLDAPELFAEAVTPLANALGAAAAAALPTLPIGVPAAGGRHRHAGVSAGPPGTDSHGTSGPDSAARVAGPSPRPAAPHTFAAARDLVPQSAYRAGYGEYLRTAGLGEIAAVAIPGFTGILVLTGAGGLLGYRQARAGHAVRSAGTVRFLS